MPITTSSDQKKSPLSFPILRRVPVRPVKLLAISAICGFAPQIGVCEVATEMTAQPGDTQTVIVTARRREEHLKDVPIAVSSFSGNRLETFGPSNLTVLQQVTPNLTLQVARGSNSTLLSFIRGVGQQDPLWGFEPGVGLYVDDVYIARPQGAILDLQDVQRIEVLKGPQGTLYGRNTIGGAVKYVTRPLDREEVRADITGIVGSYAQKEVTAKLSSPIMGRGAIGAAITRQVRGGYGRYLTTGADQYDKDIFGVRLSVEFDPSANLTLKASYDHVLDKSNARSGHREVLAIDPSGNPVYSGADAYIGLPPPGVYDTYAGLGHQNRVTTQGGSLTAIYALSPTLKLKSISAYREGATNSAIDYDNTPQTLLDVPVRYRDRQASQELQVHYEAGRVSLVAGLYYIDGKDSGEYDTQILKGTTSIYTQGDAKTRSLAAFIDASYDLTDKWSVGLGGRQTSEHRTARAYRANFASKASPAFGGTGAPTLIRTDYNAERNFDSFTPRVSTSYALTPKVTAYASYAEGFKSGGFDPRGDAFLTPQTENGFRPETVHTIETGLKGSLLSGRVQFAAAAFSSEYQDVQIIRLIPVGQVVASLIDNSGKAYVSGFEWEGRWQVSTGLSVTGSVGHINARYDEYISRDPATGNVVNLADRAHFQNTPEWSGALGFRYQRPLLTGRLILTSDSSYRSSTQVLEFAEPRLDQKDFSLHDVSASWTSQTGRYTLGVYVRNLTNSRYKIGGYNFPWGTGQGQSVSFANSIISFYGPPRTISVALNRKF